MSVPDVTPHVISANREAPFLNNSVAMNQQRNSISHHSLDTHTQQVPPLASLGHSLNILSQLESSLHVDDKDKQLSPRKMFYEFFNAPITKFWAHSISYIFFLCVFTYLVLVKLPDTPQWPEWFVISYIFTLLFEKIREILSKEPEKFRQKLEVWANKLWNVCDLAFVLLFIVAMPLRLQSGIEKEYGRVLYCVDIIYWYIRILEILSANKYLGPLVMMIGKMVKNMAYFVVLLLVVLMAFGVCRQSILFPDEEPNWRLAREIFYQPYFMLYGEVFAGDIDPPCGGEGEPVCRTGHWITPAVMSLYLLVANILLINLLIAVFNNIFTSVNAISHQVWMFQRFQVVMEFEEKPVFPPPLIIFSHMHRAIKYFQRYWQGQPFQYDNGLKLFLDNESLERIHDFEEECISGYIQQKEHQELMATEERVRIISDRQENVIQRLDDMHTRVNRTINGMSNLDIRLKQVQDELKNVNESYSVIHRFMIANLKSPNRSRSGSTSPRSGSPTSQASLHRMLEESKMAFTRNNDIVEINDGIDTLVEASEKEETTILSRHGPLTISMQHPKINKANITSDEIQEIPINKEICESKPRHNSNNSSQSRDKVTTGSQIDSLHDGVDCIYESKTTYPTKVSFRELNLGLKVQRSISNPTESSSKYARSVSSTSSRPVIQIISPSSPPPILPLTSDYTSLGDELESACMVRLSPPPTPTFSYPHTKNRRTRYYSTGTPCNILVSNPLRDAEQSDYQLMESIIQKRIHRNSENLAASLEELCAIRSELSDIEYNALSSPTLQRSRRGSRSDLKSSATGSLDNVKEGNSSFLNVPSRYSYRRENKSNISDDHSDEQLNENVQVIDKNLLQVTHDTIGDTNAIKPYHETKC